MIDIFVVCKDTGVRSKETEEFVDLKEIQEKNFYDKARERGVWNIHNPTALRNTLG